jgi:hypothetical protein
MTTQAVTSTVGSETFSRTFGVTATDGQWNNVVSTLSSQAIGLEIPNTPISFVQLANTAEHTMLWRIIDGRSLVVRRTGMSFVTSFGCVESAQISPYVVQPQDLLQCYGLETSADNKSNALGLLYTPQGVEPFGFAASADDGSATAIVNINTAQTLGDYAFGTTLLGYEFQLDSTHTLNSVQIIDQTGGTVYTAYGSNRLPAAGGKSYLYNIKGATNIGIMKGWTMKLTTESNN